MTWYRTVGFPNYLSVNKKCIMQKYKLAMNRITVAPLSDAKFQLVSEWLLFYANSAIFQLYHGNNKLIFNEMMMWSAFYYTNTLSWIFIVLAHWNNSPQINMSHHSDTIYPDQSSLFLLNTVCLAEKQQIPIFFSLVWPDLGLNPLNLPQSGSAY